MQDSARVRCAGGVDLEMQLAGPFTRFWAWSIDRCLIVTIWVALLFQFTAPSYALAIFVAVFSSWSYHVVFEVIGYGQTPGKTMMGIRVICHDGVAIGWRESWIRNLCRSVDIFPVALAALVRDPLGRRLGDMAAGTMVVRDRAPVVTLTRTAATWTGWEPSTGSLTPAEMDLIERFVARRHVLPPGNRERTAENLFRAVEARLEPGLRGLDPEQALVDMVSAPVLNGPWATLAGKVGVFLDMRRPAGKGRRAALPRGGAAGLMGLQAKELSELIGGYESLTAGLARARSLGAPDATVQYLNAYALAGHHLLHGSARRPGAPIRWTTAFARCVWKHRTAVLVSALCLWLPALLSYAAISLDPSRAFDLVPPEFYNFVPSTDERLHSIPELLRPTAASGYISHNVQLTFLVFSGGLTFGIATIYLLVSNGMDFGAVAGHLASLGQSRAFWGWVMPHGATEEIAFCLSGAAGLILAGALIAPGLASRVAALQAAAVDAIVVELGCMVMLLLAGCIEGMVTPSDLSYQARLAVLVLSLGSWCIYFVVGGRSSSYRAISTRLPSGSPLDAARLRPLGW